MGQAISNPDAGLHAFRLAAMRSERGRIVGMIGLFGFFALFGLLRMMREMGPMPEVGGHVFVLSAIYLATEIVMLRFVGGRIRDGRVGPCKLLPALAVIECLFPTIAMVSVIGVEGIEPHILPIGPGYAAFYLLLIMSTLRADVRQAALVGLVSTAGYASVVVYGVVLAGPAGGSPIPTPIYVTCVVLLAAGGVFSAFVARRVRTYVESVAREGELRAERDRVNRDMEAAREIQQRLLPSSMPTAAGYDLAAFSRPADKTGGDYYDWQPIGARRIVLSIADVTGHGIGPALVTAACRAYVRSTVTGERTPEDVIRRVDGLLSADMPAGRFVTFAMVDLDFEAHRAVFLSAGHGPSFFIRGADAAVRSVEAQGLPLGIGGTDMLDEALTFELAPGDVLVLFSDGFFEWVGADGEQFGVDRLGSVVVAHRHESAERIIAAMDEAIAAHAGGRPQPDDMTAVVVKRLAVE